MMQRLSKTPNLTELAYRSVKQQLLNGSFREGAKLTEESLAAQLGISKSPVREALMRLESEGLICIEARRGAYCRMFSAKEVADLFAVRELLEVHGVGMVDVTPSLLCKLAASVERTRKHIDRGDRAGHIEEDIAFHRLIADATNNLEFARLMDNVQQKSLLCRMVTFDLSALSTPASHEHIYMALRDGDRQRAQSLMRDHILYVRDVLLASMNQRLEASASSARAATMLPQRPSDVAVLDVL
jgi:DNA-binding GntR family transcriptional regulator